MRSVSRRLIDRIMGILLSLLMLLNMFPAVAVYAEDAKPTVYFEVLDEEGNVLDANASVKKDDVIQLNMYLSSGTGASMMDFLVSYDNDVVENINQYVNGAQGAHQYKECLVGSVLSGATTNPQYEENGTRYIKFLHEQLDPIEQGGLIATYKFKVLSARGGTTAFSVEKDRDDFIFYDGDMESLPFTQESALNALERQTNKLNTMIDKYMNGTLYKVVDGRLKLQVACPVEVSVYNMAGEQVAFVGNETSWATDGIEITQDGEEKSILVMNDEQLCFVITGTNEGVFTVSIEEQDGAGMAIGRLNYYDVPISADQSYEVTTKEGLEANGNDMPLVSENETVQADEYIAADRPKVVSISADAQADDGTVGGTVTGVGTYVPGDLVTLCAEPNDGYEFIGWFDGDTLKSVSSAYHFAAREDSMLCAQFYHDTAVHVNAYADGEGIALGGGSYQKGENVILVAIDDDDANVTFLGWFNGDAQVSAEREYQFTASEDVELTARWQTEPKYVLGDVNNDGKINVVDAYLIRCYAAQLNTLDDTQQLAADVNRDGRINVVDAYLVRCYAAQLIKEFPAA